MNRPFLISLSLLALAACAAAPQPGVHIKEERRHDETAFTQGLEMVGDRLFESRGLYGQSAITELDPATGAVINRTDLSPDHFGEGLTIVDGEIVQLTWKAGVAYRWTLDLVPVGTYTYAGEGWGLCWDGQRFVMSDGTATLTLRDRSFSSIGTIHVTDHDGTPVDQLNELECANGQIYANIWHHHEIVRIDPATGTVTNRIDLKALIPAGLDEESVLNGLAHTDRGTWLITGKRWPVLYETLLIEPDLNQQARGFRRWADQRYETV